MSIITTIRAALDGAKTYVIAAILVLGVIAEKGLGYDIPGFDVGSDWMTVVLGALGLGALRAGIAKS